MPDIIIQYGTRTITRPFLSETPVAELLDALTLPFARPCAGNRTCGKCKIKAFGALTPLTEEEKRLLTLEERLSNVRLACCAAVTGGCRIELQPLAAQTLTAGTSVAYGGPSLFGESGWALAADIGTTTVAAYLVRLSGKAEEPRAKGAPNAQAAFGADVISRIQKRTELGPRPLQDAILRQLDGLFSALLAENKLTAQAVKGAVLAGNTTMLHLLSGLDPAGIAAAPFTPESLFGVLYEARELFGALPPGAPVYLAPCIDAYVGADTVCALLACGLRPGELLLDAGTNGEMALMTAEGLYCCSAAAGPAFEGAGLKQGMPAAPGAICSVKLENGVLCYETVGGAKPLGLCGSGAVCALAAALACGAADETGRLADEYGEEFPIGDSGVSLTQQDIRQLQLAKAAIAAGLDALLERAGYSYAQITRLYLAGGFGTALPVEAAGRIGLFPPALCERARPAGNAAGAGACMLAASEDAVTAAEALAERALPVTLSGNAYFNERYMEQMLFAAE